MAESAFKKKRGFAMANDTQYKISEEGLAELKEKLDHYLKVRRIEVSKRIAEARSYGDLSENSEYDAAKQEQAQVEAEIEEMQSRIEHAVVYVKEAHYDQVKEGCTVTLLDLEDNTEETYSYVGTSEADPLRNCLSSASLVGKTINGKVVGDVIHVTTKAGELSFKIVNIEGNKGKKKK